MSNHVLVLSDSVALPREKPEHTFFKDSWPELLRNKGFKVTQCSIGGATSGDLLKQCFYYNTACFNLDIIIIQCGIVDCAPRFLKKNELKLLQSIPFLGKKIIKILNKNWIRKTRKITYTPATKFVRNVKAIQGAFKGAKIYFVSIAPAHENYEKHLPGVTQNIQKYNALLTENTNIIEISGVEKEGMMSDYHHFNNEGHRFIARQVMKRIEL